MKRSCDLIEDYCTNAVKKVALVNRNPQPCGHSLVSTVAVGKKSPNDLVELAMEIQKADDFIYANASNKLQIIAQQVRFLQEQAKAVLLETKVNLDLHHAACNFVKVPGNTYHLYRRPPGQTYFGMLSPQEWTNCPHEYLGSYRLEMDHSWTPVENINNRDAKFALINKILSTTETSNVSFALENTAMDM